jgi:hypothetical protein
LVIGVPYGWRPKEAGWVVFCSANNSTAMLAFRNDRDTNPDTVTTSEDRLDDQRSSPPIEESRQGDHG